MKYQIESNAKSLNFNNTVIITTILFFFSFPLFSQVTPNNCEIEGKIFYPSCLKYIGECSNDKANGWGYLYQNNNDKVRGLFIDNKLQDLFLEYYRSNKDEILIGPNKGLSLHGPCVQLSHKNSVYECNYDNGVYRGVGPYFQIHQETPESNVKFSDPDAYSIRYGCKLIPNTTKIIYTSAREYNAKGYRKFWITILDLKTNKITQKFGSYENPISLIYTPKFEGFTNENNAIYSTSIENTKKYYNLNISNGIMLNISSLPSEIISLNKIKEKTYANYSNYNGEIKINNKTFILKDSSYVKMYNSNKYYESISKLLPAECGSGSSLVIFNKNHEIIKSLDLPNYNITDFDIDEKSNRIALHYIGKDSTHLSYFDLNTLGFVSSVFSYFENSPHIGAWVKFSKTGTYLLYKLRYECVNVYLGNKLYYGLSGDHFEINEDDNVIISFDNDLVRAYDLEKKTIIWESKIDDSDFRCFSLENKLYVVCGQAKSWEKYNIKEGIKVKENGIKLISFTMPKPIFDLKQFSVKPEYYYTKSTIAETNKSNKVTRETEQSISNNEKSENDYLGTYFALQFLSALLESSKKYSSSSNNSNNQSNSSNNYNQSNKNDVCRYCNPSNKDGWHITDYNALNKTYPNSRYIKRPGYKPCETCRGTGDCRVTTGSNGPSAYPMVCEDDGTCKICHGDRFVKCSSCKGSGKSN